MILNWRQPALTLESLQAQREMDGAERCDFLLIDNGSGDDSVAIFEKELPQIEMLALPENIGFGRGNNVGLALAVERGYRLALLINNDAFPKEDMLTRLLAAFEADMGMVTPKIYFDPDRDRIWFFKGRQQRLTLNLRDSGYGEIDVGQFGESGDSDYLPGACMLINVEAAKRVGFFDERFFMYYEELDWAIRMRSAGYRLYAVADAHLYHRVSVSSGGIDSPIRLYHLSKSAILFYRKHWRKGSLLLILLFRLGNGIKIVGRGLLTGRFDLVRAYLMAVRDGIWGRE